MRSPANLKRLANRLAVVYGAIIVLLPFHAFFTTWLGSNLGGLDAWRIWKEIILTLTVPFVLYLAWHTPKLRTWLKSTWLPRLMLIYMVLFVGYGVADIALHRVATSAVIYAFMANLRYLVFFLFILTVGAHTDVLRRVWAKLVFIPAAIVVMFGLLQRLVLPYDFLKHFGYGPNTIPAYQTVDQKIEFRRIQSTLRGANPLGAYLLLVTTLWLERVKRHWAVGALVLSFLLLLWTYSRSAYLGIVLTGALVIAVRMPAIWRRRAILAAVATTLVLAGSLFIFRHNRIVQNTLFHTDKTSQAAQSSNGERLHNLESGLHDIETDPLGDGPGTAGPESTRNNGHARIAENYYLQIGQEVGWLGLGLFVAINVMVGRLLWQQRKEALSLGLFASLLGISFVNLLSHAWSDDTLGLLWWGLAGIALSPGILTAKRKRHEHKDITS